MRGGKRPGAGRPQGALDKSTKLKHQAARAYRERVVKIGNELFEAQKDLALGVWVMDEKNERRVYQKPPDGRVIQDMLDRAITGRPAATLELDDAIENVTIRHVFTTPSGEEEQHVQQFRPARRP